MANKIDTIHFFRLPREIRDEIYKHAIQDDNEEPKIKVIVPYNKYGRNTHCETLVRANPSNLSDIRLRLAQDLQQGILSTIKNLEIEAIRCSCQHCRSTYDAFSEYSLTPTYRQHVFANIQELKIHILSPGDVLPLPTTRLLQLQRLSIKIKQIFVPIEPYIPTMVAFSMTRPSLSHTDPVTMLVGHLQAIKTDIDRNKVVCKDKMVFLSSILGDISDASDRYETRLIVDIRGNTVDISHDDVQLGDYKRLFFRTELGIYLPRFADVQYPRQAIVSRIYNVKWVDVDDLRNVGVISPQEANEELLGIPDSMLEEF